MTWTRCSQCAEMVTVEDLARNGNRLRKWCRGCEADRVAGLRSVVYTRSKPSSQLRYHKRRSGCATVFTIGERCA